MDNPDALFDADIQHLSIVPQKTILQCNIGQVVFFLCFQESFALNIIPVTGIYDEGFLQPVQIVVDGFYGNRAPLVSQKLSDGRKAEILSFVSI